MADGWWHTASELRWRYAWSVWTTWLKLINIYISHETAARMRHATSRTHFVKTFFFNDSVEVDFGWMRNDSFESSRSDIESEVQWHWLKPDGCGRKEVFVVLMFFNYSLHYRRFRFVVVAPIAISLWHYFFLGISKSSALRPHSLHLE